MRTWNTVLLCLAAGILVGTILALWCWWDSIRTESEPVSQTVRNVAFISGGLVAIVLAWWRGIIAGRQEETSRRTLNNERYQRGVELLGHEEWHIKLGGLYALAKLGEEDANYAPFVISLFNDMIGGGNATGYDEEQLERVRQIVHLLESAQSA